MGHIDKAIELLDYYKIVILGAFLLLSVVIIYFKGTKKNYKLVQEYFKFLTPVIQLNFPKFDRTIRQDSSNVLKVYAQGRKSCIFAILGFAMVPRQQLLSFLFNSIIFRRKDELVLEIPIRNDNPPLFACAIMKKTYLKNITKKKYPDLKKYCKQMPSGLPPKLVVIAQSKQLYNLILNQKTIPIWTQNSHIIKIFYMSDSSKLSKYGFCIRLVVELKQKSIQKLPQLIQMIIGFVDKLSLAKTSQSAKALIQKRRAQTSA